MPKFIFLLLFLGFVPIAATAQASSTTNEDEAVIQVIKQLFDGMRAGDSSAVRAVFADDMKLASVFTNKEGVPKRITQGGADDFVKSVGTPHEEVYDERIWTYEVKVDGRLATAWTEYTFYLGDKMSHCGVNAFTLFNGPEGWKITNITDTRRRSNCKTKADDASAAIDSLMNSWHHAAAVADEEVFFGSMTSDAIYLGTDDSERWLRDDMREWSKKYFEGESAWAFTPHSRHIYFHDDGQMAWFEEKLNTWMGPCRGSGVVQRFAEGWKITHYNLAVTVPNDKIKPFIELMQKKK